MKTNQRWLNKMTKLGLLMMMGVSMSACATGGSGTHWKEAVLLHDGSTLIVERSFSRGGLREPGQGAPIKSQDLSFTVPGSSKTVTWTSDYSEDVGRSNFNLLALDVLNGTPYLVAEPNLCLSYNKWGRPNPPYVTFKYDGSTWQRIPLTELPAGIKQPNVAITVDDADLFREIDKHAVVSAASIKVLNGRLTQPEYKVILRDELQLNPDSQTSCLIPSNAAAKLIAPEVEGKSLHYNWWPLAQDWLNKTHGKSK